MSLYEIKLDKEKNISIPYIHSLLNDKLNNTVSSISLEDSVLKVYTKIKLQDKEELLQQLINKKEVEKKVKKSKKSILPSLCYDSCANNANILSKKYSDISDCTLNIEKEGTYFLSFDCVVWSVGPLSFTFTVNDRQEGLENNIRLNSFTDTPMFLRHISKLNKGDIIRVQVLNGEGKNVIVKYRTLYALSIK